MMVHKGTQVDVLEYYPGNGAFRARLPSVYAEKGQQAIALFSQSDFQFIEMGQSHLNSIKIPVNEMSPIYPTKQDVFFEDANDV
eukprot:CAMPEP_0116887552 /NCGR_PEP_ID=MMETSP0463-20121206/22108_1 /TAXON_ID=181622 /ORGANISM="Strombidinopsis sp, Strain SopsisLIS2011" /LENGTH=83 /DNA_ID=CAMNT_0004550499 /DNA_START=1195 /DNA_END=1446 /DNA_ORIENTATION=-